MVTKGQLNNALESFGVKQREQLRKDRTKDLLISNINQNECIKTITGDIGDIINDFHFKDREDKEIQAKLEKTWKWQLKQFFTPKKVIVIIIIIIISYVTGELKPSDLLEVVN